MQIVARYSTNFPKPRPSNLITVPACRRCNGDGSGDAEYFRLYLTMHPLTKNLSSVIALKPNLKRSLERNEAAGFRQAFLNALTPLPIPDSFQLVIEMGRIHEVIKRTGRCLYLHETGLRIPEAHRVSAVSPEMMSAFGPEKAAKFREQIIEPVSEQALSINAGGQFAYSLFEVGANHTFVCPMLFYGVLPFTVLIGP